MEEEINYSTVSFKDKAPDKAPEDGEAAGRSRYPVLACVGVGILCVLVVGMVSIIYLDMELNEQRANHDAIRDYEKLTVEKSVLEEEMRNLSGVAKNLNRTLDFILSFRTFPVNQYCPNKKCQACPTDWILFKEKCYLFYEVRPPWLNWMNSRRYCQDRLADLVVIDNPQEQEFISNQLQLNRPVSHGYFIGLEKISNEWVWIDGRRDTLGYWMDYDDWIDFDHYALFMPGRPRTASWTPADRTSQHNFICEAKPYKWSTYT